MDGQDCAHHSHNRVVHVPDAHRDRHHRRGIALCRGSRLAQVLVTVGKLGDICLLMVEDLDDFLPRDHLFDIAVERTQRLLLTRVELLAARARITHVRYDSHVARHSDERKTPIENKHQDQRSHRLHGSLNHRCEAVVERLGNGVHVVGEKTHDVARPHTVKIGKRKRLDMRKQVAANVEHHPLRRANHNLRVAQRAGHAQRVDGGGECDKRAQSIGMPCGERRHNGIDHIGAQQVSESRNNGEHTHDAKRDLGVPHVGKQAMQRMLEVFRARLSCSLRHGPRLPSKNHQASRCRHAPPEKRRFPGK